MDIFKLLQLFAEGGEGGDSGSAADSGVSPADAGQDFAAALRAKGVPESKIRKDRAYKLPAARPAAQSQKAAASETKDPTPNSDAPPEAPPEALASKEEAPKKPSFDELLEDADYKAEYERRSKENAANVRRMLADATNQNKAMAPAVEVLSRFYKLDPNSETLYEDLKKAVESDGHFYEQAAFDRGKTVEAFMQEDIQTREETRAQREQAESIREQTMREWSQRVRQESQQLKEQYPDFDFEQEMKNPAFARMLNPYMGLSVEDAYYHVHRREIEAAKAELLSKQIMEQVAASIRAGQARPTEAGAGAQTRTVSPVQPAAAYDPKHSAAIKEAVSRAKAYGTKIYPGMI